MKVKLGKVNLSEFNIHSLEISENCLVLSRQTGIVQYSKTPGGRKRITTGYWSSYELGVLDGVWNDLSG